MEIENISHAGARAIWLGWNDGRLGLGLAYVPNWGLSGICHNREDYTFYGCHIATFRIGLALPKGGGGQHPTASA